MSYLPSAAEVAAVEIFSHDLLETLAKIYPEAKFEHCGSSAKGTWVAGKADVDIYVLSKHWQRDLERAKEEFRGGEEKKSGPLRIWSFKLMFPVDLVFGDPAHIKTDTIKHTAFFKEHLSFNQKTDVIALKAFWITEGTYSPPGITGVAIEELVRNHGNAKAVISFLHSCKEKPFLQDPVMNTPRDLLASISPERWVQIQGRLRGFEHFKYNAFTIDAFFKRYSEPYTVLRWKRRREGNIDHGVAYGTLLFVRRQLKQLEPGTEMQYDVFVDENEIAVAFRTTPVCFEDHERWRNIDATLHPEEARIFAGVHNDTRVDYMLRYGFSGEEYHEIVSAPVERKIVRCHDWARGEIVKRMREKGYVSSRFFYYA